MGFGISARYFSAVLTTQSLTEVPKARKRYLQPTSRNEPVTRLSRLAHGGGLWDLSTVLQCRADDEGTGRGTEGKEAVHTTHQPKRTSNHAIVSNPRRWALGSQHGTSVPYAKRYHVAHYPLPVSCTYKAKYNLTNLQTYLSCHLHCNAILDIL